MEETAGIRLSMFRRQLGLSQEAFAASLGVSASTVAFIERGERLPSKSFLLSISDRYGISSDWLLYGVGERQLPVGSGFQGRSGKVRITPSDRSMPAHGDFRVDGNEFILIRHMELSVSAGRGLIAVDTDGRGSVAFSRHWLLDHRINADLAVLVRVEGDSMAPLIPDGAMVLVHLAENAVDREGVYAFSRGEASFIKRLVPATRNGDSGIAAVAVISDNPAHGSEVLTGVSANELRIVGRIRCVITTI